MPLSGWITFIFTTLILFGGIAFCLKKAMKG